MLFCRVLEEELEDRIRIVAQTGCFVAFVPYAALSPFSMYLFPRRHMASLAQIQVEEIHDFARTLQVVLAKLYYGLAYNFVIRTAPTANSHSGYYDWYLSLTPRVTKLAGFELGSGRYINVMLPEASAEFLRNVEVPASVLPR